MLYEASGVKCDKAANSTGNAVKTYLQNKAVVWHLNSHVVNQIFSASADAGNVLCKLCVIQPASSYKVIAAQAT